jgi:hypothetical protein
MLPHPRVPFSPSENGHLFISNSDGSEGAHNGRSASHEIQSSSTYHDSLHGPGTARGENADINKNKSVKSLPIVRQDAVRPYFPRI